MHILFHQNAFDPIIWEVNCADERMLYQQHPGLTADQASTNSLSLGGLFGRGCLILEGRLCAKSVVSVFVLDWLRGAYGLDDA